MYILAGRIEIVLHGDQFFELGGERGICSERAASLFSPL